MAGRGLVGSLALLLLAGSLAGCTHKRAAGPDNSPPPAAASPSASSRQDIAARKILEAYDGYHRTYDAAASIPDPKAAELTKYIGDPLLSQVRIDLQTLAGNGLQRQGSSKRSPKVTDLLVDATPPVATIQDCYDVTDAHVVNRNTGKRVDPPDQAQRYVVTSQAKFFNEQIGWLIVKSEAERTRPC
jgi:hypothetical protein